MDDSSKQYCSQIFRGSAVVAAMAMAMLPCLSATGPAQKRLDAKSSFATFPARLVPTGHRRIGF